MPGRGPLRGLLGCTDIRRLLPPAEDQRAALDLVESVMTVRSQLDRATLLGAVRQGLRLPLGSDGVPQGALHLQHADSWSVVVASVGPRTRFLGELAVRDRTGGCLAEYAVLSWHEHRGRVCGADQLRHVRCTIADAIQEADPAAVVDHGPEAGGA